jgi:hypothetical protein
MAGAVPSRDNTPSATSRFSSASRRSGLGLGFISRIACTARLSAAERTPSRAVPDDAADVNFSGEPAWAADLVTIVINKIVYAV